MANTDIVTGAKRDIYVGDIKENRPVSENLNNKIAGNVQFLLERLVIIEKFIINGYINNGSLNVGVGGIVRVQNQADISNYTLAIRDTGSGGSNQFNIAVYNSSGSFINNLFSTAPSISGNSGVNVLIGKDNVDTVSPSNFSVNTGGHTINHGTLSLTTLEAGYVLVPFMSSYSSNARNLAFSLKLKEQ